ncbi:MAG TPA: DNRLRE domain-containing protein, partial [bacterium]|nr:DNRLRE domain-containing protein [bacterium]
MPASALQRGCALALASVAAPALLSGAAFAASYDLTATQDTWLRESSPLDNRGTDQELRAQTQKLDSERPLLAFDAAASITPGDYVLDARMILHTTQEDGSVTVDVFPVTKSWTELGANWQQNGSAYLSGKPWGSFQPVAAGSVSVDVTGLVQQWVNSVRNDYGIALIPRGTAPQTRYGSRESGTASERPHLVVTTGAAASGTANLEAALSVSDATPGEGGTVTWSVVVRNLGKNLATSVTVAAAVPAGTSLDGDSPSQGSWASGTGIWTVGSIAAGDSATLDIHTTVDDGEAGTRVRFTAAVTSLDQTDPVPGNDSAEITAAVRGGVLRVASGLHFGSGIAGTPIIVGFQPDVILVKDAGNRPAAFATSTMNGLAKVPSGTIAAGGDLISAIDSTGFTVGSDVNVNESGRTYHWTAMRAAAGQLLVGEYVGDGSDDRGITGVGFSPSWVIVAGEGATGGVQRFATLAGDSTLAFDGSAAATDRIQALEADGFQVGTDPTVNSLDVTYHFAAWGSGVSDAVQATYVGDGADGHLLNTGFAPGFATVIRDGDAATFRPASVTGDATQFFSNSSNNSDRIQALLATAVELGKNNDVNANNQTYHWFALGDSTGPRADLTVAAAVSDSTPDPNDVITLTYQVRNNGPDGAASIVLTDALPADLAYQSAVPSQGSYSPVAHEWTVGAIAAGDSASIDLVVQVADEPSQGSFQAPAAVTAVDVPDSSPGDEADSVLVTVSGNDLQVSMSVDDPAPGEGDTVRFQTVVKNAGAGTSSAVSADAVLPPGLSWVADSTSQGSYTAGTGVWSIGALAAGDSASLFLSASVDPGTAGSTITAASWMTSSGRPDPVAANDADS